MTKKKKKLGSFILAQGSCYKKKSRRLCDLELCSIF